MQATTTLVLGCWALMLVGGMGLLLHHGTTAGPIGTVGERLPPDAAAVLEPSGETPLVVLCAHPQCPCLPSTLVELRRVLTDAPAVDLRVLTFAPSTPPAEWDPQASARLQQQLPDARHLVDRDGILATRLGAATSGHVFVFAPTGELRFSGGITAGRGHVGDNAAARALGKTLTSGTAETTPRAVFGCPLQADEPHLDEPRCCELR